MAEFAYKYNKARNRDEAYSFPGVPLRDITVEEFKALPKWLQQSVKASEMYSPYEDDKDEKKPAPDKAAEPAKAKEKE